MASFIGKVQIGGDSPVLVGSTLYGICASAANATLKDITANTNGSANPITGDYVNTSYDNLIRGSTIHIKFIHGNTVTSGVSLLVGTLTTPIDVIGDFTCPENTIISFTLDENQKWVVNDNVDTDTTYTFTEGTTDGSFNVSVNGAAATPVVIHGLNAAAYKAVSTTFTNTASVDVPTVEAVAKYVSAQTGGLSGLTGAMHFRGIATSEPTGSTTPTGIPDYETSGPEAGDVVLHGDKEFVWTGSAWELLGDEGSYALKTSTGTVISTVSFTANTLPQLSITSTTVSSVSVTPGSAASLSTTSISIPNVTQAGTPTTATVTAGILVITSGTATVLGTAISVTAVNSFTANTPTVVNATDVSVGSASGWNAGAVASFNSSTTSVVVP